MHQDIWHGSPSCCCSNSCQISMHWVCSSFIVSFYAKFQEKRLCKVAKLSSPKLPNFLTSDHFILIMLYIPSNEIYAHIMHKAICICNSRKHTQGSSQHSTNIEASCQPGTMNNKSTSYLFLEKSTDAHYLNANQLVSNRLHL